MSDAIIPVSRHFVPQYKQTIILIYNVTHASYRDILVIKGKENILKKVTIIFFPNRDVI